MLGLQNLFFINFLIFLLFIQENFRTGYANEQCLNLKLKPTEKLDTQVYFQYGQDNGIIDTLCHVAKKHLDRVTMGYKIGPLAKKNGNAWSCPYDENCDLNRYLLCDHQIAAGAYDNCGGPDTLDLMKVAECFCNHGSDSELQKNADDWANLKLPDNKLPTITLNGKYDPCLDVSSEKAFEAYIEKILNP